MLESFYSSYIRDGDDDGSSTSSSGWILDIIMAELKRFPSETDTGVREIEKSRMILSNALCAQPR